jgi:hypothetical protein
MIYSLLAMTFVGSTCGATLALPLIPTWIASLIGAITMAYATTLVDSPWGDLCRSLGMRVVAFIQELWKIVQSLGIIPKAAIVTGQIIDKCMILDRQHKVKDKLFALCQVGYVKILQTVNTIQQSSQQQQTSTDGRRARRYNDDKRSDNDEVVDPYLPGSRRQRNGQRTSSKSGNDQTNIEGSWYQNRIEDDDPTQRQRQRTDPPPFDRRTSDDSYFEDDSTASTGKQGMDESNASPPEKQQRGGWFRRK